MATSIEAQTKPAMALGYRIGELAQLSGVSAANIRYYEKEKLLSPHGRSANSYRFYSNADLHQLRFIRQCRTLDMSLNEVRTLLALDLRKKSDCATARVTLDAHLGHVRARLAELTQMEASLEVLRNRCDGSAAQCRIMEALHAQADQPHRATPSPAPAAQRAHPSRATALHPPQAKPRRR